jgi:uncharacterized protein (UPF0216 family)
MLGLLLVARIARIILPISLEINALRKACIHVSDALEQRILA